MRYDFHVHYKRHARDAQGYEAEMVRAAIAKDLDGICFTEHFQRLAPERLTELRTDFPQIKIWSGVEVTCAEGSHILFFGGCPIPDPGIPWDKLKAFAREHIVLTCLAHPWRRDRAVPACFLRNPPNFIELESRNTPPWAGPLVSDLLLMMSGTAPLVNSDAHKPRHIGWHYNYRFQEAEDLAAFLENCS